MMLMLLLLLLRYIWCDGCPYSGEENVNNLVWASSFIFHTSSHPHTQCSVLSGFVQYYIWNKLIEGLDTTHGTQKRLTQWTFPECNDTIVPASFSAFWKLLRGNICWLILIIFAAFPGHWVTHGALVWRLTTGERNIKANNHTLPGFFEDGC